MYFTVETAGCSVDIIIKLIVFCVMENHPTSVKDRHAHSAGKMSIEIYLILRTKTASRPLLYEETSRMHCSGVNSAHSSTQTVSRPLLWDLTVLSIDVGFRSGDLLLIALFSFLETNSEFSCPCVWDHPDFNFIILEDGVRFWSRPSLYMLFPPPDFTVHMMFLEWYAAPFVLQTWWVLCHPKVSSLARLTRLY